MPDPVTTTPPANPPADTPPATPPPADEVTSNLLPRILGLIKDEPAEKKDQPAAEKDAPEKKEAPATPPEKKDAPATTPPAEKKETPPPAKKVAVKKGTSVADEVRKVLSEAKAATPAPAPAPAPVAKPAEPPVDEDLTPEEREELALAEFAEKKDAGRKGLGGQFRKFFKAQKDFLEKAAAKAADAGEDYDPAQDPKYKQFLATNEPKFTPSERKRFSGEMIADKAREEALKEAESRFTPELDKLKRKTLELERRPQIDNQVAQFATETESGMPDEVVKFYRENGEDEAKTREAFPMEFDIISRSLKGAARLADDYLSIRNGLVDFDPKANSRHGFLASFVTTQADVFARNGGDSLVRDGKQFIHPSKWSPDVAATHWTFDDKDVLEMIKVAAQNEAKGRIQAEESRLQRMGFSRVKKGAAPIGTPPAPKPEPAPAPRVPVTPLPGASTPSADGGDVLAKMLKLV